MSETALGRWPSEKNAVTALDSTLWRQMLGSDGRAFFVAWLSLQCRAIDGTRRGLLMLAGTETGVFEPSAVWPENAGKVPDLVEAAKAALVEAQAVVRGSTDGLEAGSAIIAFPIVVDDKAEGSVALATTGLTDPRAALRQLQWGIAGIREHIHQRNSLVDRQLLDQSKVALDLLAAGLAQEGFEASALAVVTELALRFQCTRASLGFVRRRSARIVAISHTAQFRRQMNLLALLTGAMNEAIDQRCVITFPAPGDNVAMAAHAELSHLQVEAALLTIPIFKVDRFIGAMTFERPRDLPFEAKDMQVLEAVVAALGPVLDEKRRNDRWLIVKLGDSIKLQLTRLLGPGHLLRKLGVVAAIAAVAFFYVATQEYRVDADAQIEGLIRRAVVAAYDGFLREADARAGDTVKQGQVIAALDDRDLALERLRWIGERQQRTFEYDKALASRQPAAINVTKAQIDQADAQIKLLDEQLARITIRSPIAGLVVSGDLSQLVGAAVNRGQVLFEIAPLDGYRVLLSVDERQIDSVKIGQHGSLLTNALPNEPFSFVVDKLTPIADARAGRNVFRVEGRLTENSARLRPGMEGVAKIDIGRRRLIWIWTHSLVDWFRIWAWQWLP